MGGYTGAIRQVGSDELDAVVARRRFDRQRDLFTRVDADAGAIDGLCQRSLLRIHVFFVYDRSSRRARGTAFAERFQIVKGSL